MGGREPSQSSRRRSFAVVVARARRFAVLFGLYSGPVPSVSKIHACATPRAATGPGLARVSASRVSSSDSRKRPDELTPRDLSVRPCWPPLTGVGPAAAGAHHVDPLTGGCAHVLGSVRRRLDENEPASVPHWSEVCVRVRAPMYPGENTDRVPKEGEHVRVLRVQPAGGGCVVEPAERQWRRREQHVLRLLQEPRQRCPRSFATPREAVIESIEAPASGEDSRVPSGPGR